MFRLLPLLGLLSAYGASAAPTEQSPLNWQPCVIDLGFPYNNIQSVNYTCATLQVPLDYTNSSSRSIPLQLIRVPAKKQPFKGSVLFNPGGPGGSGIQDVAITGGLYQTVLGGQYDLIGFDPRGTGNNIPFDCKAWNANDTSGGPARRDVLPERNLEEELYAWGWEASGYLADRCAKVQGDTGRFLTSAFVSRDMLKIVDALQEDGMLRYWGISYGTQLGNTFAAMFPDRVDRMFLDAVVNPLDYTAGYWLTATLDTDKVFLGFLDECVKAGPRLCPIATFSGPGTTSADLLRLTNNMFEYLLENNVPLGKNVTSLTWDKGRPGDVYTNLKGFIFQTMYAPSSWVTLALLLNSTLALDFSIWTDDASGTITNTDLYNKGVDAFWGIACSDNTYRASTPEQMVPLVQAQQNVSSWDDALSTQLWPCYRWKIQPAERYTGNYQARTNHPILYVNGLADPITPDNSAFNASAGFDGSVVLTHGGYGHGFYSDPSLNVARAIRTYFINGTLPAKGTYYEADFGPFNLPNTRSILNGSYFENIKKRDGQTYSDDDKELLQAVTGLNDYYNQNGPGPLGFRFPL